MLRATLNVAQQALQMLFAAFAQMLRRALTVLCVQLRFLLLKLVLDQIEHAYIIYSSVIALYSLRMSCSQTPQVELPKLLSVCTMRVVFCLIISIYSFHLSLVSSVKPRYLHVGASFISPYSVQIAALTLMRLRDLVKQVSQNLLRAKTKACIVAYCCAFLSITLSVLYIPSIVLLYAKIATLLIYPIDIASVYLLHYLTKSALYRIQSRRERGDP